MKALDDIMDLPLPCHHWEKMDTRDDSRFRLSFMIKVRVELSRVVIRELGPLLGPLPFSPIIRLWRIDTSNVCREGDSLLCSGSV